jgi:uncharacterized protein (TIGR00270 family)
MQCELCGREGQGFRPAEVDGVEMILCPNCMVYGKGIDKKVGSPEVNRSSVIKRIKKPSEKDVYREMDKELVSNWNEVIEKGRKAKGLTREELGFKIGERTVTIAKIENGDLRPSDKIIKNLEKILDIKLFEQVKEITAAKSTGSLSRTGLTLGDFVKTEEK